MALPDQEFFEPGASAESASPIDDVFGPLELPSDRPVLSVRTVIDRLGEGPGRLHVVGAGGCAPPWLAAGLARRGRQVVLVTLDIDTEQRAHEDAIHLSAELGAELPPPLLFAPAETSAYAEVPSPRSTPRTGTGCTWSTWRRRRVPRA